MDFSWSKEQLAIKRAATEFALHTLNDGAAERDADGSFSRELWRKCADYGIQGYALPGEYGGGGHDILDTVLLMEGLGAGCRDNGLLMALNTQMWTVQLSVQQFGDDAQKRRFLPALARGEMIGAQTISEPESGSDAFTLATTAERTDGGYLLNGVKSWITLGPVADLFVLYACLDRERGKWGTTAFLVENGTPGLSSRAARQKMGLRGVPWGDLTLNNCEIPRENRLGPEGAGMSLFNASLEWERSCMLASHVGVMERQLKDCVDYARKREQFGKAIGKFQSVSNRMAEMKVRLETARLLLYRVAWLKSQGRQAAMEAAMAKLYLTESLVQSSMDAIAIHGAKGYSSEFGVERDLRDAIGSTIYGGTADIQRQIIASFLGL